MSHVYLTKNLKKLNIKFLLKEICHGEMNLKFNYDNFSQKKQFLTVIHVYNSRNRYKW